MTSCHLLKLELLSSHELVMHDLIEAQAGMLMKVAGEGRLMSTANAHRRSMEERVRAAGRAQGLQVGLLTGTGTMHAG